MRLTVAGTLLTLGLVQQARADAPDGGWTIPRSALAQGEPRYEPEFTAKTSHGVVGVTGAGRWGLNFDGPPPHPGELTIARRGNTLRCEFGKPFHCPGALRVRVRGDLLLACVSQFSSAKRSCAWESSKAALLATSRMCVLVDLKQSACHDLTVFDDARLLANGRIELRSLRDGPLRRAPATLEDLAHVRMLECEHVPFTSTDWWGPFAEVRAVARFDDGFTLLSTTPYAMSINGQIAVDDEAVGCKTSR